MIEIETDTRKIKPGQTYVAITGHTVDGHDFIQKAIDAGKLDAKKITKESLLKANVISKELDGIRLLARGAITAAINITVDSASKSAVEAVKKAGGKVTVNK